MYKTPTLTSKISPFHCASHDPMPNLLIDTRVQTRRDYTPDDVIYWQFLLVAYTANARAGKSMAKKVAAPRPMFSSGLWFFFLSRLCCFIFHPFFTI